MQCTPREPKLEDMSPDSQSSKIFTLPCRKGKESWEAMFKIFLSANFGVIHSTVFLAMASRHMWLYKSKLHFPSCSGDPLHVGQGLFILLPFIWAEEYVLSVTFKIAVMDFIDSPILSCSGPFCTLICCLISYRAFLPHILHYKILKAKLLGIMSTSTQKCDTQGSELRLGKHHTAKKGQSWMYLLYYFQITILASSIISHYHCE